MFIERNSNSIKPITNIKQPRERSDCIPVQGSKFKNDSNNVKM